MQKKSNNSGITLIALIITIIVMLILVAVTVNTAVNSGLFGHAKNATQGWKSEEEKESNIGNDNYINDTVNQFSGSQTNPDNKPDRSFLKVGDYIAYNPDTAGNYMGLGTSTSEKAGSSSNPAAGIPQDTTLKWRVMNINDDGSVDLISATPISTSVYFQGSIGYNNGVLLLNELCKTQYSNNTLGVTSRSINLEDIEKNFNSTGIAARNSYTSSGNVQYGNIKTYSENYSYSPDIYDKVGKTTAEESKNYYTTPTTATHTQKGTLEVQYIGLLHVMLIVLLLVPTSDCVVCTLTIFMVMSYSVRATARTIAVDFVCVQSFLLGLTSKFLLMVELQMYLEQLVYNIE